jgi:hypothetical protein
MIIFYNDSFHYDVVKLLTYLLELILKRLRFDKKAIKLFYIS